MKRETFRVNISSPQDADKVKNALEDVWGVRVVEVNENTGNAKISFDEYAASIHDFEQAITEAGYKAQIVQGGDASEGM